MIIPKFKVGDRVICSSVRDGAPERNPFGTITAVNEKSYRLDFDGEGYKGMTRAIEQDVLRKLTKLDIILK